MYGTLDRLIILIIQQRPIWVSTSSINESMGKDANADTSEYVVVLTPILVRTRTLRVRSVR
jgi:hypothetical protein